MWYFQKHLSLVGSPVVGVKSSVTASAHTDFESRKQFAGDPLYNVLNECCWA